MTAEYFEGADARNNPLTPQIFRQSAATIIDTLAHRIGHLPESAYQFNEGQLPLAVVNGGVGGDGQRETGLSPAVERSIIRDSLPIHFLNSCSSAGKARGNQLATNTRNASVQLMAHSLGTHIGHYGIERHGNQFYPLQRRLRGLTCFEFRHQLLASLWFQAEIIDKTVSLDLLFRVLLVILKLKMTTTN